MSNKTCVVLLTSQLGVTIKMFSRLQLMRYGCSETAYIIELMKVTGQWNFTFQL